MKLVLCLMCPMLTCILVCSADVHLNMDSFINLILDIRGFYSAATVIFAHPEDKYGNYGDLQSTLLVHTCSRMLGRHYIMSLNIHFSEMYKSVGYYHRIVRPLVMVILPNSNSLMEFAEATKDFPMSFPVWFVLFMYSPANSTRDYCHQPLGNFFNLAFDTQMLVMCNGDDILREWYSVRGESTKIFDLAKWSAETRFVPLTKLALYDRRNDMEGAILRAVTVKDAPVAPITGDYVAGLYGKVLDELTQSLNFTLNVVAEAKEHGMWNHNNRTWSGAMGEIVSGRVDFAIADMSMTSLRIRYVDFTLPLIISRNSLFIKEPMICGVKWFGYFQAFSLSTWSAIIMVIAVTPLLLCFMKTCRGSRNTAELISDDFICIWGVFCQQALTEFPKYSSLRVAYFAIFCTAILITAYYSAALVCFLTACVRILPFRTFDEFLSDRTYKLIVPRGSADYDIVSTSKTSISIQMMQLMKKESELPSSVIDGFLQVRSTSVFIISVCTEKNVAFFVLNALKTSVEMKIPCKLSRISTEKIDNLGMVLSKHNPYTNVINYHLQKFLDNGIMMRLKSTTILMQSAENIAHEPVRLVSVIPILAILCVGIILGAVILAVEKLHYRSKKKIGFQPRVFYPAKKQLFITNRRVRAL